MKTRTLMACGAIIVLLGGCATQQQPVESPQMLVKENTGMVENSAENIAKPPVVIPPPETVVENVDPAGGAAMDCHIKGKPVMLDDRQIGITVHLGYCSADLKPDGSKIWIPQAEVPMLGNISVDDACNITYCPTSPHYDHFGISDGNKTIQVQVKWQDSEPVIY